MSLPDVIARPLIAGMFIYGGLDSARKPAAKADAADKVTAPLTDVTGLSTADLVRINGIVQIGAGAALALGFFPRPAAVVLGASLIPTTLAAHRFWETSGDEQRTQTIQFLKNTAMLGGLVLAAASHGGRPSFPWRARRAVHKVVEGSADRLAELPLVRS